MLDAIAALDLPTAPGCDTDRRDPDDWSLGTHGLRLLEALVAAARPRVVVEFGSGASTAALARACAALDPPAGLVALENDPEFMRRTAAILEEAGVADHALLVAAPVVARRRNGRYVPVYHLGANDRPWSDPADLVVLDGPPLPLGGREGALDQALHAARPGAIVVLDDARRDSEQSLLARALRRHEASIEAINVLGFPKGLAVIMVTGRISSEDRESE